MDWLPFFEQHGIEYVEHGPNVSAGNVNIQCPFCGAGDPSHHLGVSLRGDGWGCWRDPNHRGKSAVRLIRALIGCSYETAMSITTGQKGPVSDLMASVDRLLNGDNATQNETTRLRIPDSFHRIDQSISCRPYANYLARRGFSEADIASLSKRYGLRYCTGGVFGGRIMFILRYDGEIVGWTGRAISKKNEVRYRSLTHDHEKATTMGLQAAPRPISDYVLWYDKLSRIRDKKTLVITEGPFDALNVNVHGRRQGIYATCIFKNAISNHQAGLICDLASQFRRTYLILDSDAFAQSLDAHSRLAAVKLRLKTLPKGVKDPGELTKTQLLEMFA